MHPLLFHIGSYPVRAYSLAVLGAFLAAWGLAVWLGRRRALSWVPLYSDFVGWAALGGIIGARLWEVAFQWPYYGTHMGAIFAIWEGGLSVQGGVIGGLLAAWLFTRLHRLSFPRFLDESTPSLLLGQAVGRLFGSTLNGDAFGKPTGTAFGLVHAPGTPAHMMFGAQPLWPAEVLEGLYDLALLALLVRMGVNRGPAGQHFMLYVALYSAGRFTLEFLRADTTPGLAGLTPAQLGSAISMLLAGGFLVWQFIRTPDPGTPMESHR